MKSSPVEWLIRAIDRHLSEEAKDALCDTFKTAREMESLNRHDRTTTTCAMFTPGDDGSCIYCSQTKESHI